MGSPDDGGRLPLSEAASRRGVTPRALPARERAGPLLPTGSLALIQFGDCGRSFIRFLSQSRHSMLQPDSIVLRKK
jgi:hypothetical protein